MHIELNRRGLLAMTAAGIAVARAAAAKTMLVDARDPAIEFIEVNGARLAYQHHVGPGRHPLVFLHGYGLQSTSGIYARLFRALSSYFELYALDMRGHGGSAGSIADWSQETIADDAAAFTKALGLRSAAVAGHSLGGFTATYAQIRHPSTFSSLLLLATSAAGGGGAPPSVRDAFVKRGRDTAFLRETFSGMYRHAGPGDIDRSVAAIKLVDPSVHTAFYSRFAATKIIDRLGEIDVPVLVVSGARDNVVAPIDQYRTALGIPSAREVTFADQGHMLPIEAADATAREMLAFVRPNQAPAQ